MSKILLETIQVEGIPIIKINQEGTENCPLIFFIHGFTADKREGIRLGYELAKSGFCFVGLDALMHGERFDTRLERVWEEKGEYVYPFHSGLDAYVLMHEIIIQTAQDIDTLLSYFEKNEKIDTDRIGITGFSMGGFATFYIAANNPGVQVAVPIAGIPGFASRWEDVVLEASTYIEWSEMMAEAETETAKQLVIMRENDPFEKLAHFSPKPLLIVLGDLDTDSPKKYSVELYRFLRTKYGTSSDRLQMKIHDNIGHQLTTGIIQDVNDWFCRYL